MSDQLDNPTSVIWSHSDRRADFYELSTDGHQMHEALTWLLEHYKDVKLWMGLETEEGAELLFTCSPTQQAIVEKLQQYDDEISIFEAIASVPAKADACVNE